MKTPLKFIIEPVDGEIYKNTKKVGDIDLVLNSSIEDHTSTNREATVVSVPTFYNGPVVDGDTVLIHHNCFRRFYNGRGEEKYSNKLVRDSTYMISEEEFFAYKRDGEWSMVEGYCLLKPIDNTDKLSNLTEQEQHGELAFIDSELRKDNFLPGDIVCFRPDSEYEFIIDGIKYYRVRTKSVCLKKIEDQ